MAIRDNLQVGTPDTTHDSPAHTPGIKAGNETGSYEKAAGHLPNGQSTAERSTGVNAESEDPIDPSMPNLSPA